MSRAKTVKNELKSSAKSAVKKIKSRVKAGKAPAKKRTVDFSEDDLVFKDFARYFFIVVALAILGAFFWVISPFFNVLIYSALMVVVFYPIHQWLLKLTRKRKNLSAFFSTLSVMLVFLGPLILFGIFLIQEALNAYQIVTQKVSDIDFSSFDPGRVEEWPYIGEWLAKWFEKLNVEEFLVFDPNELAAAVQSFVSDFGTNIVSETGSVLVALTGSLSLVGIQAFVLLLTVFFFFRDGDQIIDFLKKLSPLPKKHEDEIERKLRDSTYGIVFGNFGTAALQGLAGGVGFAFAGIENALLWGTVMAFCSLIPYVGSTVIWFPVSMILMLRGDMGHGVFLLIWGMAVIASVDNIARPFLIGGSTKMHPLPTFLVVLGGILLFGLKGIIYGPLILSIAITVIHIYQLEYEEMLNRK